MAEARQKNPDMGVTLASLRNQADHIRAHLKDSMESLDAAYTSYASLDRMLAKGAEISPEFIDRAVDAYLEKALN